MRESTVENHLVAKVRTLGGIAYKFTSPGRRNVEDRLVMLPTAMLYFIECKAPGKRPRPGQKREHDRHRAMGFNVLVLDTKEKVDRWALATARELYSRGAYK